MASAILVSHCGGPEVLEMGTVNLSAPGPHEVRIRHTAIGVNYIDTYYRSGLYKVDLPFIPGEEAVGVVEDTGAGASDVKVGDRVAYVSVPGAYCTQRIIHSDALVPVPDHLSDQQIAASLTRGLTAEYLLFRCYTVTAGRRILVYAAAGGVGSIVCQWAKSLGAMVIGAVGDPAKIPLAEKNGCDEVIVYTQVRPSERVRDITRGGMVDVVYDGVGRDTLPDSICCVKPRGLVVCFGNASGAPEPLDVLALSRQGSVYLTRPRLHDYVCDKTELTRAAKRYFEALTGHKVNVPESVTLPLPEAKTAHEILQDRSKTVIPVITP